MRKRKKLYKCINCERIYAYEQAKESNFFCEDCGTLLVKISGEKAPEVAVERHIEMESETRIGYGVWAKKAKTRKKEKKEVRSWVR